MTKKIITLLAILLTFVQCSKPKYMSKASETTELILSQYVKNMRKRCPELIPMGTGGGVNQNRITLIGVPFECKEVLNIDRARELMLISVEELENTIFSDEEFKSFFDKKTLDLGCYENCIIGESGKDPKNYIYSVMLLGNRVVYSTEKSPGAIAPLILVHEETLDEARAIVYGNREQTENIPQD